MGAGPSDARSTLRPPIRFCSSLPADSDSELNASRECADAAGLRRVGPEERFVSAAIA